jgi:hypothetical protein
MRIAIGRAACDVSGGHYVRYHLPDAIADPGFSARR